MLSSFRGLHYVIHTVEGPVQLVLVADIPDKEPNPVVALELLRHVPLLHLVAGVDDDFLGGEVGLIR